MRLKQFGLSQGQISDLLSEYNEIRSILLGSISTACEATKTEIKELFSDEDFIKFCLKIKKDDVLQKFALKKDWTPLNETILKLNIKGISYDKILKEYLPMFLIDFTNQFLGKYSIDYYFIRECHCYWSIDPENPDSNTPKRLNGEWKPSDKTLEKLQAKGASYEIIMTSSLEYRLYWTEHGGEKRAWEEHFINWFCRRNGLSVL